MRDFYFHSFKFFLSLNLEKLVQVFYAYNLLGSTIYYTNNTLNSVEAHLAAGKLN